MKLVFLLMKHFSFRYFSKIINLSFHIDSKKHVFLVCEHDWVEGLWAELSEARSIQIENGRLRHSWLQNKVNRHMFRKKKVLNNNSFFFVIELPIWTGCCTEWACWPACARFARTASTLDAWWLRRIIPRRTTAASSSIPWATCWRRSGSTMPPSLSTQSKQQAFISKI